MSADLDDLARLAQAATPGPWEVDADDCGYASPDAPMVATPWVGGRRTHIVGSPARPHGKPLPENAEFIAAASPATILRLIEALRLRDLRLSLVESERDDLRSEVEQVRSYADMWRSTEVENETARDRLAARLAAVEALLADGPDTWEGFESHDTGHVFVSDVVLDFTADLRAALAAPTDTTKEN